MKVGRACKWSCPTSQRQARHCQRWAVGCHFLAWSCPSRLPREEVMALAEGVPVWLLGVFAWRSSRKSSVVLGTWCQIFKMVLAICCLWKQRVPGCEFPAFPHSWKGVFTKCEVTGWAPSVGWFLPETCQLENPITPSPVMLEQQLQVAQRQICTRHFRAGHWERDVTTWDRYNSSRSLQCLVSFSQKYQPKHDPEPCATASALLLCYRKILEALCVFYREDRNLATVMLMGTLFAFRLQNGVVYCVRK